MPLSKRCCLFWGSILASTTGARTKLVPSLSQAFFFDWNTPGQPVPIPTTQQCETIHITWQRSTAVGPNPTAPYYLQVYTSTAIVPFVIPAGTGLTYDWAVPFAPGTQYQICMFDKLGNTGGCQATYTVIPPPSTPNCTNVTFPPLLDVQATVNNGPMSQFGWVDQCTDISILPKNGTAPYTLTIAPALHPPYNITSPDMSSMNWTVSLSWASPFFISLVDSGGNMWSNGPLHSGSGGTTACLAENISSSPSGLVQPVIAIGAGVGGLVVGLLIGLAATYLFIRRSHKKKMPTDRFVDLASSHGSPHATVYGHLPHDFHYSAIPTTSTSGISPPAHRMSPAAAVHRMGSGSLQYHVEPFVMPDEDGRLANEARPPTAYEGQHGTGHPVTEPVSPAPAPQQQSHVYVLHHDSNIPPVTIFHENGTEIVELPPRYPRSASQSDVLSEDREGRSRTDNRSDGSRTDASQLPALHQPRQPTKVGKSPRSS